MNIFILSLNCILSARYAVNSHVIKMILEYAQLLCTAHRVLDTDTDANPTLYKVTHKNHPCAIWARASSSNYDYLYTLFISYCYEYSFRYNKIHLCHSKFKDTLKIRPKNIPIGKLTPFALAMPDECKTDDPVESYRNYYNLHKRKLFKWKERKAPDWVTVSVPNHNIRSGPP